MAVRGDLPTRELKLRRARTKQTHARNRAGCRVGRKGRALLDDLWIGAIASGGKTVRRAAGYRHAPGPRCSRRYCPFRRVLAGRGLWAARSSRSFRGWGSRVRRVAGAREASKEELAWRLPRRRASVDGLPRRGSAVQMPSRRARRRLYRARARATLSHPDLTGATPRPFRPTREEAAAAAPRCPRRTARAARRRRAGRASRASTPCRIAGSLMNDDGCGQIDVPIRAGILKRRAYHGLWPRLFNGSSRSPLNSLSGSRRAGGPSRAGGRACARSSRASRR